MHFHLLPRLWALALALLFCVHLRAGTIARYPQLSDIYLLGLAEHNLSAGVFASHSLLSCEWHNAYFMKEMMTAQLRGLWNYKQNLVAARLSHFGGSAYGDMTLTLGYGRSFARRWSFALQGYYLWQHAQHYPSVHSFTFDLSLYLLLSPKLAAGVLIFNPAQLKYAITGDIPLPVQLQVDLTYMMSDRLWMSLLFGYELRRRWCVQYGIAYQLKMMMLQVEVALPRVNCTTTLFLSWRRLLIGATWQYDLSLGWSPKVKLQMLL